MPKIETSFCDECVHAASNPTEALVCAKGHKPRFHKPRTGEDGYLKFDWGYKRRCEDFEPAADTLEDFRQIVKQATTEKIDDSGQGHDVLVVRFSANPCPSCNGLGEYSCPEASSMDIQKTGYYRCPECGGSGIIFSPVK